MSLRHIFAGFVLLMAASVSIAQVLPEDRVDVLMHRYDGGGVTIDGPSLLVRKRIGTQLSVVGNYYVDSISSASIDVVTQASKYDEERTEISAGVDYLLGDAIVTAGYGVSDENDFKADTASFNVSQEFFGGMSTLSMGFGRGWDTVTNVTDPSFSEDIDRRDYRLGLSQVLTENMLAGLSLEVISDEGYLNNPYRSVRYEDPGTALGYAYQQEVYPNTRTSTAVAVRGRYYLPYRAAVSGEFRYFSDDWDISAQTYSVDYTHPWREAWVFDVGYRYYTQTGAEFYSDLFPYANYQNFMGRDKELSSFSDQSLHFGVTYEFLSKEWGYLERGTVNFYYDYMMFSYDDFRDLRVTGVTPGTEPLYDFNADVFQLFISLWF